MEIIRDRTYVSKSCEKTRSVTGRKWTRREDRRRSRERDRVERTFTTRDFSSLGTKLWTVCLLYRHGITKSRIPATITCQCFVLHSYRESGTTRALSPRVHFTSPLYCFAARPTMGRNDSLRARSIRGIILI